jgi:PPOX class probable F420-dependent enzyme
MSNPTMTRAEREAFLSGTHVGVLTVDEPGRGPCTTPVWYAYAPGGAVHVTISPTSRKAALIRKAGRVSLCAQSETPPYGYVTVEGPAELLETDVTVQQREIAERYLGPRVAARYLASNAESLASEVLLRIQPVHWRSVDFSKLTL